MTTPAPRRPWLLALVLIPTLCVVVGTTVLDTWAGALIFLGLAVALHAGGGAMRAFAEQRRRVRPEVPRQKRRERGRV
ncbi:MAG: hypothetical protein HOV79_13015 [Hamadaea sp.]|nr:hypothetical protein [Hamadaea sp.]